MNQKYWYRLVEGGLNAGTLARLFSIGIIGLIILNAIAVLMESHGDNHTLYLRWFIVFEIFSVAVFTIEYALRVWVAPQNPDYAGLSPWSARWRHMRSPVALIDLAAILPAYLSMFVAMDLRVLRLLRLLRLMKLTHYFSGLNVFFTVLRKEARTLLSAVFTIAMLVVVAASLMYTLEHDAQPEAFGSIPSAIWWAVVTMTTVGYGDVTPITGIGRVIAAIIMLLGVGIVALPAGMLAARFGEELQARKDHLHAKVDLALKDGALDAMERQDLEALSKELGVTEDALDRALHLRSIRHVSRTDCPHCGKRID
jgi:voltage-gated potassium channel